MTKKQREQFVNAYHASIARSVRKLEKATGMKVAKTSVSRLTTDSIEAHTKFIKNPENVITNHTV
jgi:hypothetical protein